MSTFDLDQFIEQFKSLNTDAKTEVITILARHCSPEELTRLIYDQGEKDDIKDIIVKEVDYLPRAMGRVGRLPNTHCFYEGLADRFLETKTLRKELDSIFDGYCSEEVVFFPILDQDWGPILENLHQGDEKSVVGRSKKFWNLIDEKVLEKYNVSVERLQWEGTFLIVEKDETRCISLLLEMCGDDFCDTDSRNGINNWVPNNDYAWVFEVKERNESNKNESEESSEESSKDSSEDSENCCQCGTILWGANHNSYCDSCYDWFFPKETALQYNNKDWDSEEERKEAHREDVEERYLRGIYEEGSPEWDQREEWTQKDEDERDEWFWEDENFQMKCEREEREELEKMENLKKELMKEILAK